MPVHLYGQWADMKAIQAIARKHNLIVIEDNAQAIDARGADFAIGELSDAVCTSFIIQKNLGTFGDGGAVVTNRDDIVPRVRALRNHGSQKRSVHSMGYNSRLDDLHAGILSVKLKHIDEWSDRRREIAGMYTEGLKDTGIQLPTVKPGYRHVFHLYVIEVDKRDAMLKFLNRRRRGRQDALPHRHPSAGRLSVGQGRRPPPVAATDRTTRGARDLAAHVPRADAGRDRLHHRSLPPVGEGQSMSRSAADLHGGGRRDGQARHAPCRGCARNPRFEVVGLCDIDAARLDAAATEVRRGARTSPTPAEMLAVTRARRLLFCTLPHVRLPLIRAGVEAGVQLDRLTRSRWLSPPTRLWRCTACCASGASRAWSATSIAMASTTRR